MDVVSLGSASCMLGVCSALSDEMQEHVLELTRLRVPESDRGQGHASALLRHVCEQADGVNKTLLLTVAPFEEGPSIEKLRAWYARFGFIEIQEEPCLMARMPGSGPRALH